MLKAPLPTPPAALEGEHWWFRGRRKVYLAHLRAALGAVQVGRALDLSGAQAGFARHLASFARDVVAIDAVPLARAGHGAVHPVAGDALRLPFADRAFDLVTSFDALERAEDEPHALSELRRVLRPGGLAVVAVPARDWLNANRSGAARSHTRASLRRALESADLAVERITHANVVLFPLVAPTVLLLELLQRLRLVPTAARSLNLAVPTPPWLSAVLYRAFTSELSLSGRFDLPFGHSIVALARRPVPSRTKRVKRRVRHFVAAQVEEPAAPLPATVPAPPARALLAGERRAETAPSADDGAHA